MAAAAIAHFKEISFYGTGVGVGHGYGGIEASIVSLFPGHLGRTLDGELAICTAGLVTDFFDQSSLPVDMAVPAHDQDIVAIVTGIDGRDAVCVGWYMK